MPQSQNPLLTLSQVYAEKEEFELAEDSLREGQSLVDQMEEGTEKRAMQGLCPTRQDLSFAL